MLRPCAMLILPLLAVTPLVAIGGEVPRYAIEVRAAISKAGCNAGICHGNQNGKGGLKLSLRGQDPRADYRQFTRQAAARRINLLEPEKSLLLEKPSGRVPHVGGIRLSASSPGYRILRDWIAAGAPPADGSEPTVARLHVSPSESVVWDPVDRVPLRVEAEFSDGARRDVTSWAVYEPSNLNVEVSSDGVVERRKFGETTVIVRYLGKQVPVPMAFLTRRDDFSWPDPAPLNAIDTHVFAKLQRLRIAPAELCSDTVFVRRAYLDVTGLPPTADAAKAFVADPAPDKRSRLIDRLLASPEFIDNWTLKWSDVLRNEEKVLDTRGVDAFYSWIRDSIRVGKPLDAFVRELITSKGSTYDSAAANFYRANRAPDIRGETAARLFLGVRLQCAKCHNHPFDVWTQDDYYGWASLFARIDYKIVENKRKDKFDKNEFVGEQIVLWADKGEVVNARTGDVAKPRLLGAGEISAESGEDRLTALADWLAHAENPLFARAQANWIWFQLMGQGVVEPVDDFRQTNPASNPALLEHLADELTGSRFDLRHLVRQIVNSRAYQASSRVAASDSEGASNFAHARLRRLAAEQLLDAQSVVLGQPATFVGYQEGVRANQIRGVRRKRIRDAAPTPGDRFLATFGKPQRLLACDCERSNETTLNQALELVAGQALLDRLQAPTNRLAALANSDQSDQHLVEELFWWALSRPPSEAEREASVETLAAADNRLEGMRDVAWALLNAKEFIFRR